MDALTLRPVEYRKPTARRQEIYNFETVVARLADCGFNCLKPDDGWMGADFLDYHKDRARTVRVQLKGHLTICRKYAGRDLYVWFPSGADRCLVPNESLVPLRTGSIRPPGEEGVFKCQPFEASVSRAGRLDEN